MKIRVLKFYLDFRKPLKELRDKLGRKDKYVGSIPDWGNLLEYLLPIEEIGNKDWRRPAPVIRSPHMYPGEKVLIPFRCLREIKGREKDRNAIVFRYTGKNNRLLRLMLFDQKRS